MHSVMASPAERCRAAGFRPNFIQSKIHLNKEIQNHKEDNMNLITLNGKTVFSEKDSGTCCLGYACGYVAGKPCRPDLESIRHAAGNLYDEMQGTGKRSMLLRNILAIERELGSMISPCNCRDMFTGGDARFTDEAERQFRGIRQKIGMFRGSEGYSEKLGKAFGNACTYYDVCRLIDDLHQFYIKHNKKYLVEMERASSIRKAFLSAEYSLATEGKVTVCYTDGSLTITNGSRNERFKLDNFRLVSGLFSENGIHEDFVCVRISGFDELGRFIRTFACNKSRSMDFEDVMMDIYRNGRESPVIEIHADI